MQIVIDVPDNNKQKEKLLKLLAQENDMVLSQAYLYAKNLVLHGIDVAEKWSTVTQQSDALYTAYLHGRHDEAKNWNRKEWRMIFTINQAWRQLLLDEPYLGTSLYNAMFDIVFIGIDGNTDETEFTVRGRQSLSICKKELTEFWKDFSKAEGIPTKSILHIIYKGQDPLK